MPDEPLIPRELHIETSTGATPPLHDGVFATEDHATIRTWAARRQAEPATGEATASGPSTVDVNDGGAGIRFNFPGAARFRPISWGEWFDHFQQHELLFVFEEVAGAVSSRFRLVKARDLRGMLSKP